MKQTQHRIVKKWDASDKRWEFWIEQRTRGAFFWSQWDSVSYPMAEEAKVRDLYLIAIANSGLRVVVATEATASIK